MLLSSIQNRLAGGLRTGGADDGLLRDKMPWVPAARGAPTSSSALSSRSIIPAGSSSRRSTTSGRPGASR